MSQADFVSAAASRRPGVKRVLIASANPYSFCIGVERHLARALAGEAIVDGLDLYRHAGCHAPFNDGLARRLAETVNRKYKRFIVPELSGTDITAQTHLPWEPIPPLPGSLEELRDYRLDGARIGLGVLSSIVSLTTLKAVDDLEEFGPQLRASWRAAHLSLRVAKAVQPLGYDEIYLFNGRHCYARPFRDYLEQTTRVIKYEVGGCEDTTTFVATDEHIHEPRTFAAIVSDHQVNPAEGEAFYRERIARVAGNEVNHFIGIQTENHVPEELAGRRYVAFLTSSTDERVAALGKEELGAFNDQNEVALALADECRKRGLTFAVRLHPHLRFKNSAWRREWDFAALEQAGAIIIEPNAECDSYALARGSYAVVSAGSTMSFECSFLDVPNAVVGDCLQTHMGSSVACLSREDLAAFLDNPVLPPHARDRALVYGSYMRIGGTPIHDYELNGHVSQVELGGRTVDPVRRTFHRLKRLIAR